MALPEGYKFRKLELADYENNYLETLKALTVVGDVSSQAFDAIFSEWSAYPSIYHPHVITNDRGMVVATGMLLVEKKAIHQGGLVGHIEDIAVAKSEQGKRLGHMMITSLSNIGESLGCYKIILDCSPHNTGFYEKCGFTNSGAEMVKRFDH